jgi:hypothetical protein
MASPPASGAKHIAAPSGGRPAGSSGRRSRAWWVLTAVAVGLLIAACTPSVVPTPARVATPAPSLASTDPTSSPDLYAATFEGDATGGTDVSAQLTAFFEANAGKRVALAVNGVYSVSQVQFTATGLTVDFRGSRLAASEVGVHGILRLQDCVDVTLNDPAVTGTGYAWEPPPDSNQDPNQNEHGIQIDGGSGITLNRPVTRDTRGDGIYTSFQEGQNDPPTNVVLNDVDIERASRNGIAPVAGEVTIQGGRIVQVGLHGVDFEVNDAAAAESIIGVVDGVDIRRHGDLPGIEADSYAVAAGGYSEATKQSIVVENLTGDDLRMTIRNTALVTVRNNVSDRRTTASFPGAGSVDFGGNVGIDRR